MSFCYFRVISPEKISFRLSITIHELPEQIARVAMTAKDKLDVPRSVANASRCVPTRMSRLASRPFTFIIRRFTTGSHYRMQIRGAPRAEGQSRGFGKKQPHAAPSYVVRNEKVSYAREIVPRRQLQGKSGPSLNASRSTAVT